MRRRSLLAMMGLAPAAAAVGPIPAHLKGAPRVAQGGYASLGLNTASDALRGAVVEGPGRAERLAQNVIERRARLAAYRYKKQHGLFKSDHYHTTCPNIESRRATSPAIKAILQRQHYDRAIERELEGEYERAVKLSTILVPEWLQDWL